MGKSVTEKLNEELGIEVVETQDVVISQHIEIIPIDDPNEKSFVRSRDVEEDYDKSRSVLNDVMDKGTMALDKLIELAEDSEHPRAYEVVGSLIKNIVDAQKATMDLHKVVKDIGEKSTPEEIVPAQTVNNTQNQFFVGSTKDLQEMIEDEIEEENG